MSEIRKAEPGWLARSLSRATRQVHARFHPADMVRMGRQTTLPISDSDAAQLYADFDARFLAWTGKRLREWKAQ